MEKLTLTVAALFALCFVGIAAELADAQGFHFGGGGMHVDVSQPYGGHGYYPQSYYPHTPYWGGGWSGYSGRHDTFYYDYYPRTIVPHSFHYDAAPAYYNVHSSGHWSGHF